eukprot:Nk52_evm4s155 gene=Nk52_evmTU4s155
MNTCDHSRKGSEASGCCSGMEAQERQGVQSEDITMQISSPESQITTSSEANGVQMFDGDEAVSCVGKIRASRKLKLFVVFLALFIDYFLLTVVVPILPEYLDSESGGHFSNNSDIYIGLLFAAKPIVQLICNPIVGAITDRELINSQLLLMIGFVIMCGSTLLFGMAESYGLLLTARGIQGVGSSLAAVAGFATLAVYYVDNVERGHAMSFAYLGVSLGVLLGPPVGGFLYEWFGKSVPFYGLAVFIAVVLLLLLMVVDLKSTRVGNNDNNDDQATGTADGGEDDSDMAVGENGEDAAPRGNEGRKKNGGILQLLQDPYILLTAGAMLIACTSIALLEPTLPVHMRNAIPGVSKWQLGVVFLPCSGAYLIATPLMGYLGPRFGRWLMSTLGLILIAAACALVAYSQTFYELLAPMAMVGFGIGMTDAPLLPELGRIVDLRHGEGMYGNAYAIGDMAMSLGSIVGPLCGGLIVQFFSFKITVLVVGALCFVYAPFVILLKRLDGYDIEAQLKKRKERESLISDDIEEIAPSDREVGGEGRRRSRYYERHPSLCGTELEEGQSSLNLRPSASGREQTPDVSLLTTTSELPKGVFVGSNEKDKKRVG